MLVPIWVDAPRPPLDTWFEVRAYPSPEGLSVFFQNVSERRRAEETLRESHEALRRSQEDLSLAVEAAHLGTFYCDYPLDRIVWNDTCKEHFFLPPEAEVDIALFYSLLHPDDREPTRRAIERALAERVEYDVEYRTLARDGRTRWVNAVGRFYYDDAGHPTRFDGVTLDISARKAAEEESRARAERERFLAGLAERARVMTDPDDVIADAVRSVGQFLGVARCVFVDIDLNVDTCTTHPDYRADESVVSMAGVSSISAFGDVVVAEYGAGRTVVVDDVHLDRDQVPEGSVAAYDALGIRAHVGVPVVHSSRLVSCIGVHSAVPRRWKPEEVELLQTVVERTWLTVEVARQQRALGREAEATARILESITDGFFTLDRDWNLTRVNDQAERLMTKKRGQTLGRNVWDTFPNLVGTVFEREYRRAMNDRVAVSFEVFYAPLGAWLEVRAYPYPDGLSVFYQDVTRRKEAEAERERLLAEERTRAEREALLNRIGQALRGSHDPEDVQGAAADLLGEALGADRCYVALYDLSGGTVRINRDWHRADLASVQGVYPFPNTAEMFQELYHGAATSVIADAHAAPLSAQTRANMERLQLCARVSAALVDGDGLMATLTAAMTDGPRQWTEDEVALVEAVATQLRTAVAMIRVHQREHAIAQQLQDALQPAVPEHVPGLSVGTFTRPALDEAQVGGDFYDIFPLDKELFAVVIGDVSGKGLAAAQQLALIRNSLRTTLYLSRAPAEAASALNTIVTSHDLLVGFVTAWVGVYDAATGQVRYCSCGHEPGLVRRAGGTVEVMGTTGPPLGVAEGAQYGEGVVTLSPGEALLLYTDGLSESGPSRRELLGTGGLMRLLAGLEAGMGAQAEADALFRDVSTYTNGVFRDDVALLLLRRE